MKLLPASIICLVLSISCLNAQLPDTTKYKHLDPYDFHLQYLRTDSALLIDVREPFEFRGRRIKDAINIPSSGNIEKSADTLNHDLTYFLYCTTDYRSIRVAEKLYEAGFRKLVVLDGGINAWRDEKMPTDKKRERGREKAKRRWSDGATGRPVAPLLPQKYLRYCTYTLANPSSSPILC